MADHMADNLLFPTLSEMHTEPTTTANDASASAYEPSPIASSYQPQSGTSYQPTPHIPVQLPMDTVENGPNVIPTGPSEFMTDFYSYGGRRVLPARQRKGEFGSNEYDSMIQEAMNKLSKQEAYIPGSAEFRVFTNVAQMSKSQVIADHIDANLGLSHELPPDTHIASSFVNHGYFRNEEVRRNVRSQITIERAIFSRHTPSDQHTAIYLLPPPLQHERVEDVDDVFYARYLPQRRVETKIRITEREKWNHGRYQLNARVKELKSLDASYFKGEGPEEQEDSRRLFLASIPILFPNTRADEEEEDLLDVDRSPTKPRKVQRKKKEQHVQLQEDVGDGIEAPPKVEKKERKKKESTRSYFTQDEEIAYALGAAMSDDEPKKKKASKGKKATTLGKRKRFDDGDYGFEEHEEQPQPVVEEPPPPPKKKPMHKASRSLSVGIQRKPIIWTNMSKKNLKEGQLLDQARKFNPGREPRDNAPLGAPFPTAALGREIPVFSLPYCVVGDEVYGEGKDKEDTSAEQQVALEGDDRLQADTAKKDDAAISREVKEEDLSFGMEGRQPTEEAPSEFTAQGEEEVVDNSLLTHTRRGSKKSNEGNQPGTSPSNQRTQSPILQRSKKEPRTPKKGLEPEYTGDSSPLTVLDDDEDELEEEDEDPMEF